MGKRACAIIGCSPLCFPWGFDEEDEYCCVLKLVMLNRITALCCEGVTRFHVVTDCGAGLYASEMIDGPRETDPEMELICYIAHEQLATKWTPELRDRYFNILAASTELVSASTERTVCCEFEAYLRAMDEADTVLLVYDPNSTACEREIMAKMVAERLGKEIVEIDVSCIGSI